MSMPDNTHSDDNAPFDDQSLQAAIQTRQVCLAADVDAADADDGPVTVTGVILGEGDQTVGTSGVPIRWPRETLEQAVADGKFDGLPLTKDHPDPDASQPPVDSVIGEVTNTKYEPGTGVLWQGEVDDPEVADKIDRDRLDVSAVLAAETEPPLPDPNDEDEAADTDTDVDEYEATRIAGVRDLGVVAQGAAPSNEISMAEPQGSDAKDVSAEALSASFDADTDPADPDSNGDLDVDDSHDHDHAHANDLEYAREDTLGALHAADQWLRMREETGGSGGGWATTTTSTEADSPSSATPAADAADGDDQDAPDMDVDVGPILTENRAMKRVFAHVLEDESPFSADQIAERFTFEGIKTALADAGVAVDASDKGVAEVLTPDPKTGGSGDGEARTEALAANDAAADDVSAEDREELQQLHQRITTLDGRAPQHVEELRAEAAEIAGVDEYGKIDFDQLNSSPSTE